jgi:hypothetical protein
LRIEGDAIMEEWEKVDLINRVLDNELTSIAGEKHLSPADLDLWTKLTWVASKAARGKVTKEEAGIEARLIIEKEAWNRVKMILSLLDGR